MRGNAFRTDAGEGDGLILAKTGDEFPAPRPVHFQPYQSFSSLGFNRYTAGMAWEPGCGNTLWAVRASFKIRHLRRLSLGSADPSEYSRS